MSIPCRLVRSSQLSGRLPLFPASKHSRHLFDELPRRDLHSLNALLSTQNKNNDPLATWNLFVRIHHSRTDLDPYTFTPVLGACSVLPSSCFGKQVHALMLKYGSNTQIVPQTALMNMYSKHSLMADSSRLFDEMVYKDVVTWNALISTYLRHGMALKAILAFEEMRRNGFEFTGFTLCSVLKACVSLNALRQGKQVHGLIITMMSHDVVVLGTALIDFYSYFHMVDKVIHIYRSVGWNKDNVMRNSFIAACVKNKIYGEAMLVMSTMKPNTFVLTSAMAACSEISDLWVGKQIHCVALRFGLFNDIQFCNSLLDMYGKCGKISLASFVFDRMSQRNVVSWTSMIDAYGANGNGVIAVELFKNMEEEGSHVVPNDVTVLAVLSACSRAGLVVQGRQCFQSVQKKYGFVLGSKHYACYIDILGRAGHVEEIWCVYEDMVKNGIELTSEVWAALMNSCWQNNDISRGEFAARKLYELEPDKPGMYLLLSNFYTAIGKWDTADQLRSVMKGKGLVKNVGISWIVIIPKELLLFRPDCPVSEQILNMAKLKRAEERSLNQDCAIHSSDAENDRSFLGEDWVIVKKQKVNILIPTLQDSSEPVACNPTSKQLQDALLTELDNTGSDHLAEKGSEERLANLKDKPFSAIMEIIPQSERSCSPPNGVAIPVDPMNMDARKLSDSHQTSPRMRNDVLMVRKSTTTVKQWRLNDGVLFSKMMRASNLERKLLRAGGLSRWLTSVGLEQFIRIFHARKISKFQLVNLSMRKLKDMGPTHGSKSPHRSNNGQEIWLRRLSNVYFLWFDMNRDINLYEQVYQFKAMTDETQQFNGPSRKD
ncbi:hypothetical protein V2J09_009765 [Rumex salicifolius]